MRSVVLIVLTIVGMSSNAFAQVACPPVVAGVKSTDDIKDDLIKEGLVCKSLGLTQYQDRNEILVWSLKPGSWVEDLDCTAQAGSHFAASIGGLNLNRVFVRIFDQKDYLQYQSEANPCSVRKGHAVLDSRIINSDSSEEN